MSIEILEKEIDNMLKSQIEDKNVIRFITTRIYELSQLKAMRIFQEDRESVVGGKE